MTESMRLEGLLKVWLTPFHCSSTPDLRPGSGARLAVILETHSRKDVTAFMADGYSYCS